MIKHDLQAERFLRGILPEGWSEAAAQASRLAEATRYLPWCDRARVFDRFLWAEAQARLCEADVTAIVNRQASAIREPQAMAAYTLFCRSVLTAALLHIEDGLAIDQVAAALFHKLSLDPARQHQADDWIAHGHADALASSLRAWPGCAFLLLILSPSDSAESFMARDAFWAAMLGRG